IKAPVAILKSLKKMTITTPPTTTKSPSMPSSTSGSPSPISKGITPTILRRASDRSGQDNLGSEDTATGKSGGRSQHERNRELWNRACVDIPLCFSCFILFIPNKNLAKTQKSGAGSREGYPIKVKVPGTT
ncbi:hypothetical protein BGZ76_010329, partial [Entomortierella beljakovae]